MYILSAQEAAATKVPNAIDICIRKNERYIGQSNREIDIFKITIQYSFTWNKIKKRIAEEMVNIIMHHWQYLKELTS